ncbi:MAG TPA: sulfatase [Sedimentisphaerales bacterium]|nr:sulfatase [Sedimentisphaerales bacterium]
MKEKTTRRDFIKAIGLAAMTLTPSGCRNSDSAMTSKTDRESLISIGTNKPNIIFILADDLGWAELGCYGNKFNETPHLDKLASQGMRFTEAYAPAPVCSPTRAGLLTGQHPARVGIIDYLRPDADNALSTDHITIAEMLKKAGYATGMIGKWHLSGYAYHGSKNEIRATDHGFDEELVTEIKGVGNGADFYPYIFRTQPISWLNVKEKRLDGKEYLVDRMNLEGVDFIERHKGGPFFLYLSHFATHTILNGKEELVEKYRKKHPPGKSSYGKCYLCQDAGLEGDPLNHWAQDHNPHLAAMLESIDDGVGMIMDKLNELGLADNTILIFTSDNGGETNVTSNAPLREGKSCLYEGGIREPLIVRWPGTVPVDTVCKQPISIIDFYPTLLQAANPQPDRRQKLDGISILPVLKNPSAVLKRDALYWHYPLEKPHFLGGRSAGAIRKGAWKLIEFFDTGEIELYNLDSDISERNNLAEKYPKKVVELEKLLADWRQDVGAEIPPSLCLKTQL